MDKLYKVFVSSTSRDLLDERQHVMNSLLRLNCMPVAMELFPADGKQAWDYLQPVIADCDYYVLIIAGKYGSMDENGVSYTEKEYDYAHSLGIPVFAFAHKAPESLSGVKLEGEPAIRAKLKAFREKVGANHTWREWLTAEELAKEVALTLAFATAKSTPKQGWIRASQGMNPETLNELEGLRRRVKDYEAIGTPLPDLATLENVYELHCRLTRIFLDGKSWQGTETFRFTWKELFTKLCKSYLGCVPPSTIVSSLRDMLETQIRATEGLRSATIETSGAFYETANDISFQFLAMGLIERVIVPEVPAPHYRLSPLGQKRAFELHAIKANTGQATKLA